MWTPRKVRRLILLRTLGHDAASIAAQLHMRVQAVQEMMLALRPNAFTPIREIRVENPEEEIQNLINYIPTAPPFFKDIAIQRLKQLC